MFKLLIAVLLVGVGCSIEEEASVLDSARTSGGATISIERADVNEDGVVNVLDLTAVSYWIGEKVADWLGSTRKVQVERRVTSELLTNPEIEVGKFFSIFVSASLDGGMRRASDFFSSGQIDPTCQITIEIIAKNGAGEIIPDAIAGFNAVPSGGDDPSPAAGRVGKPAYSPHFRVNGHGYNTDILMFFTDSALRNNVEKLIVKSGSKCGGTTYIQGQKAKSYKKKLTPMAEVAQIPVNLNDRTDDLVVTSRFVGDWGNLTLEFSRLPWEGDVVFKAEISAEKEKHITKRKHLAVMLVDNIGRQRGYYSSETGVAQDGRYRYPEIGSTQHDDGSFTYAINAFGYHTIGRSWFRGKQFTCAEGWRVLVLLQDMHKVRRLGTFFVPQENTTRIYEAPCHS